MMKSKQYYKKLGLFFASLLLVGGIHLGISEKNEAALASGDYYDSVEDSMSGTTLLNRLTSIVNSGSISTSYDWSRYEEADEDPNNSSNVLLIYARTSVSKSAHVSGSTGWNREHTFPQSKLSSIQNSSKSDNHIVYASDNKVNGARSNIKMGVVNNGTIVKDYNGNNTTCQKTSSAFDPHNEARGIVARSTMYAAAMYGYDPEDNFESIATMLSWHLEYPVTSFDQKRNEVVYKNQHNRNPFVDHPEYACRIWGNTNSKTKEICGSSQETYKITISKSTVSMSTNSSTTISATASNGATISWSSSNTKVATVSASSAASGSSITINAAAAGSAVITASFTANNTVYSATCQVTITASPKTLSSITVSTSPAKTSYKVGDYFDPTGLVITRYYSDSTYDTYTYSGHTSEFSFSPGLDNPLNIGDTNVVVKYGGKTANQSITVAAPVVTVLSMSLEGEYKTSFMEGSTFTFGGKVIAHYSNGNSSDVTSDVTFSDYDLSIIGTQAVTVSYEYGGDAYSTSYQIEVTSRGDVASSYTLITDIDDLDHGDKVYLKNIADESHPTVLGITGFNGKKDATVSANEEDWKAYTVEKLTDSYFNLKDGNYAIARPNANEFKYTSDSETIVGDMTLSINGILKCNDRSLCVNYHSPELTYVRFYLAASDYSPIYVYKKAEPTHDDPTVSAIYVQGMTTEFMVGDTFTFDGDCFAVYSDKTEMKVVPTSIASPKMDEPGTRVVTVTYSDGTNTFEFKYSILVKKYELVSISLSGMTTEYIVGETFSFDGVCTATYKNNEQEVVTPTFVTSPKMDEVGSETVTVTYTENGVSVNETYSITIKEPTPDPAEELAVAKRSAISELTAYYDSFNLNDYDDVGQKALSDAFNDGKNSIYDATSVDEVSKALFDAELALDLVEKKQPIDPEEELKNAKENAIAELTEYFESFDMNDYDDVGQRALSDAFNDGKNNINSVLGLDEVDKALANAKQALNEVEKKEIPDPAVVLANAKQEAINSLTNYYNTIEKDEYNDDGKGQLSAAFDQGKTDINNATDTDKVNEALEDAERALDAVSKDPALLLAKAKVAAINELTEYYNDFDLSKYDEKGKSALLVAFNNGVSKINRAESTDKVASALMTAKISLDMIEVAQEIVEKQGCMGSVATTSVVLSSLALIGAILLILRRRKFAYLHK